MKTGSLRQRFDIERPVKVQDSSGDPVVDWAPVARNIPARLEPLRGNELLAALAVASKVESRIIMRFRSDIDATMRLKRYIGNGHYEIFNIAAVLIDDKSGREYLTLPVTKGVNDG